MIKLLDWNLQKALKEKYIFVENYILYLNLIIHRFVVSFLEIWPLGRICKMWNFQGALGRKGVNFFGMLVVIFRVFFFVAQFSFPSSVHLILRIWLLNLNVDRIYNFVLSYNPIVKLECVKLECVYFSKWQLYVCGNIR